MGEAAIIPENMICCLGQRTMLIRPMQKFVYNKYLLIALTEPALLERASSSAIGSTVKHLRVGDVEELNIPLPPLAEQRRIVAKIDQLMARCDELEKLRSDRTHALITVHTAAIDRLLTAQDSHDFSTAWHFITQHFGELYSVKATVAELRKTILQLAVMGKLVPQDPNDEPASELLKAIELEKQQLAKGKKIKQSKPLPQIKPEEMLYEVPLGWEWCRVGDIAQLITSGSRDWAKYYSDDGAIFVTMGNLSRGNYSLRMENIRYVTPPMDGEGSRTRLEENDLLISITGDVGNLGLVPKDFGDAYINQHTCLLRFMPICRNRYFPELMRSPLAKYQFDAPQRGIKNSFRLGDVGEMIIPLPPLAEQHSIVAKIDQLMALCDRLEGAIAAAQSKQTDLLNAVMAQV
jgi:type I restriction enzyme S subunit